MRFQPMDETGDGISSQRLRMSRRKAPAAEVEQLGEPMRQGGARRSVASRGASKDGGMGRRRRDEAFI
ncbi:unnamed protein product [Lampetra fluviatilis]